MLRVLRTAKDFFRELKRRNVYRVGLTYLAVAWLVCQVAWLLVPGLKLPEWFFRAVVVAAILGFPIALVLAWAFETTPEGVRRTPERNRPAEPERPAGARQGREARRRDERRGRRPSPAPGRSGRAEPRNAGSTGGDRNGTVKLETPSPGTCEMIPAELEVVAGDPDVELVRFFDPGGPEEPAFTFGRRSAPSVTHIELDSPTVSREQARISFGEDGPVIENYSTTNPTQVNGVALDGKEASTVLEDGDLIDMGELRFRYREH